MRSVDDVLGVRVGHGPRARPLPVPGVWLARQLLRRPLLTKVAMVGVTRIARIARTDTSH